MVEAVMVKMMPMGIILFAGICLLVFVSLGAPASAQERDLPEEVRALAAVCSTGASVEFRGQIEGGINRLFGKVLAGEGELEVSKSETDFLNAFEDERLRLEARAIYNDCVLGALQIVYNLKKEQSLGSSDSRLLVPDSLAKIQQGERFALRLKDVIGFDDTGIITIRRANEDCGNADVHISNLGKRSRNYMEVGENFRIPEKRGCWITLYGVRSFGDENTCVFSFFYQCK